VTKFKYLLFDLDGTLVDSSRTIGVCIGYALEQSGATATQGLDITTLIGTPLLDIFRNHYGLSEEQADDAIAHYRKHYDSLAQAGSEVYGGIPEALVNLRNGGFRLFVATVKPTSIAEKVLRDMELRSYFEGVAGGSTGHERRDKASIIAYALAQFDLDPAQSLMIGDRDQDVLGARKNGLPCVAVTYGFGSREELKKARPDFWAGHSEDIVSFLVNPSVAK